MGSLHKDRYTSLIISRSFLLTMKNVSGKICRENKNTHFVFNNFFLRKSCHLRHNVEKHSTAGQATDNNMVHAHCMWITKSTNTYSEYAILIDFLPQQRLPKAANVKLYVHLLSC
jgi:hypothetical protein